MSKIGNPFLDRSGFRDVVGIMRKNPWAEEREEELLNLWELCPDDDERALLKELCYDFLVLDSKKQQEACNGINEYINSLSVSANTAFIVAVADVGKTDGSLVGLQLLESRVQPTDEWEDCYVSNIPYLVDVINSTTNTIFIFDDFIGSGDKIVKKYNWLSSVMLDNDLDIKNFDIHILAFTAMNAGIKKIKNELNVNIFSHNILCKAISEKNNDIVANEKINTMIKIENKLNDEYKGRHISKYSLGYNKSEALYYWNDFSCPNNVFPIFWWPNLKHYGSHSTIFVRTK